MKLLCHIFLLILTINVVFTSSEKVIQALKKEIEGFFKKNSLEVF